MASVNGQFIAVALCLSAAIWLWPGKAQPVMKKAGRASFSPFRMLRQDVESETLAVLDACVALLGTGLPADSALALAAREIARSTSAHEQGWLRLGEIAQRGGDVAGCCDELAGQWRFVGLSKVSGAWRISARYGCPLADALSGAAENIRAGRQHHRLLDQSVSGAKATIGILILLPALGIALGFALGVNMFACYRGISGLLTLWPGVVLLWLGMRWSHVMIARALQPSGETPA